MRFLNPNVSGEMAQRLQHNQEKYVPCLTKGTEKIILEHVPLHGDQLFEECARNVIWTYRDGVNDYEQLQGIDTEFADWHAKYTLYKVECYNGCNVTLSSNTGLSTFWNVTWITKSQNYCSIFFNIFCFSTN